jgi:hypothetical protein
MSVAWRATARLVVYVKDPGQGRLVVWRSPGDAAAHDWRPLEGPAIGVALRAVAALAQVGRTVATRQSVPGLGMLTPDEARALLVPLMQAAIYAAAGSERAELLLREPEATA